MTSDLCQQLKCYSRQLVENDTVTVTTWTLLLFVTNQLFTRFLLNMIQMSTKTWLWMKTETRAQSVENSRECETG